MSHSSILETKVGNESYGTRDVVLEQGHNCHLAKRRWKLLSVEMGHNTNSISYN